MLSNNFIAAVRTTNAYMNVTMGGAKTYLYLRQKGCGYHVSTKSGMLVIRGEQELWSKLTLEYPDLLSAMREDTLFKRALAQRAEMLLSSPDALASLEEALTEQIYALNQVMLEHLDATVTTKKRPKLLRPSYSASLARYELRQNTLLPYMSGRVPVAVRAFPGPFDDNTWQLELGMPPADPMQVMETQRRFECAKADLLSRGIRVGDVLNGTGLCVA